MKREIKFRGVHDCGSLTYPGDTNRILGTVKSHHILQHWSKVEQYTGIKDRNGKEIYEGDIVSVNSRSHGPVFDRLGCWFVGMHEELGYLMSDEVEVIGNIHENPELLEESQ